MRTIIIGAVALGASCAARLKRLNPNHEIILLEKGDYASFANCGLPYFVGDEIKSKDNLLVVDKSVFINRFQIDLRIRHEAIKIYPEKNMVEVFNHISGEKYNLNYDNLVLAMGADAFKPNVPGIDDKNVYYLKTVQDAITLKEKIIGAKKVCVVGGGFIGLEVMENLINTNKIVDLIEAKPTVSNLDYDMGLILDKIIKNNKVNIHTSTMLQSIIREGDNLIIKTDKGDIYCDAVVMAIGVRPNTNIAIEAGIKLDFNKTIDVNEYLQTNYPNIYCGGDLISNFESISGHLVYVPLANYANKHGRIIANNIHGIKCKRQKISMASVFKLFDYTVSSVGLNETMCNKFNIKFNVLYQNANSHASYYPNATPIYAKILYDDNGKILGGQMIGKNLVEKRIDVLSNILLHGGNYLDLMEVESSYAPPYSSAKDILNFFGFMIDNVINGKLKSITPIEIDKIKDKVFILDVRGPLSHAQGHIGNAINIPLDCLRQNLDLLPKDQTIYIHCQVGITSYNACCILKALGYDVCNVSGGWSLYSLMCK